MRASFVPFGAGALLAAACGGGGASSDAPPATVSSAAPASRTAAAGLSGVELPALEIEQRTVPLKDVYFDTFDGGARRLSVASEELIARPRDAIPPI